MRLFPVQYFYHIKTENEQRDENSFVYILLLDREIKII